LPHTAYGPAYFRSLEFSNEVTALQNIPSFVFMWRVPFHFHFFLPRDRARDLKLKAGNGSDGRSMNRAALAESGRVVQEKIFAENYPDNPFNYL